MSETNLRIRLYGEAVLRKKARRAESITSDHRDILSKMTQVMYADSGVGLAATQVGINESMIVADVGRGLYKLINPKIVKREGHKIMEEGCLSIPGICVKVKRAKKVVIKAQDEFAKPVTIEAEDLLARVFQHEIDHLNGKLIIDYASFFKRLKMRKKLEEIKKKLKSEKLAESEAKSCKLQL